MGLLGSSFLFTNIVGLVLLGLGLATRLGYLKRMFIQKKATGVYSRNTVYALIPAGLFLLSFYPVFLWKGNRPLDHISSSVVLVVLFALPLVALVWQPVWLKPAWLQWLEANYKPPVLERMFKAAHRMGVPQWETQVKTQAGLEQWADGLARKHKWKRIN